MDTFIESVRTLIVVTGCLWALGCSAAPAAADVPDWTIAAPAPVALVEPKPVDCSQADDDLPSARMERRTSFWAEDPVLQDALGRVLGRLNTATGLGLSVAPGGVSVVLTDLPPEYGGLASDHIDIDVDITGLLVDQTLIHEVGHMLGARHLGPWEGVMSRCLGAASVLLTDSDLEQICSGALCTRFQPEIRPELDAIDAVAGVDGGPSGDE